jgi:excinuclease ABC subunit C
VTFFGGQPLKSDYRRFRIRSVSGRPNDVAALAEMVRRRYHGASAQKLPLPDLILIDGGRPQVGAALAALGNLSAALVGLAKREEELYLPRSVRPLKLPRRSLAIQLLQRIRDEVHRFAVTYHRYRRARALYR